MINDLDVNRTERPARPLEADSPLVIDPDAVLPLPVALQSFKPVSGQDRKILNSDRCVELIQFHLRLPQKPRKRLGILAFGELARRLASNAHDHATKVARIRRYVKRNYISVQ